MSKASPMTQNPSLTATSKEKSIKSHNCWSFEESNLSKHSKEKRRERKLPPKNLKKKYSEIQKLPLRQRTLLLEDRSVRVSNIKVKNLHLHQSSFFEDFFKWGHLESLFYLIKFLYFGYIIHLPIWGFSFVS